jgi:curli production assembly/transport component CsgF
MTAKNDITGDKIQTKPSTEYADNYDAIFSKKGYDELEGIQDERVANGVIGALLVLFFVAVSYDLSADEIKFGFKNPSFSGVGTSSHYLTIDSQEMSRKDALKAEIKALKDEAEREAENSTLARFIKNFESRVYAQLSRQLVDQLFGENPAEEGSFELFDNLITWTSDGISITMTIFNETTGETTTITIPIGDFGF